jgi:hypothetical protein
MINTFFAIFFALSLVSASPLGRLSNEKRQNDDNVVWVTVTTISTVTIHTHTGNAPRVTKTVTVHATFGEPPQRAQAINTPTVETPIANTPKAPVVAAAPVAAFPSPVVPVTTPTASAAAVVKGNTSNTGSTGTGFTGQGTFYAAGYVRSMSEILTVDSEAVETQAPIRITSAPFLTTYMILFLMVETRTTPPFVGGTSK